MHLTKGLSASLMGRRIAALSVLAFAVIAALWALYETPYDGPWTGTNSESKAVSFTVSGSGTAWSSFSYAIEFVCSLTGSTVQTTITQSGPGVIADGTFSYSSATLSFTGAFDTSTSASGTYTLVDYPVTHGVPPPYYVHTDYITLSGTWTATFSGEVPTITVTSPNGGESWDVGTSHDITWTSSGTVGDVMVEYSTDSGSTWTTIAASTANDGTEPWTVPNTPSATCLVRVSELDGSPSDVSDAVFSIVAPPSITVTSPNGGEAWGIGSTYDITWSWTGDISNVMIEYSYTGGDSWEIIAGSTSNSGTHPWTIPEPASGSCMVRVSDAIAPGILDTSDALFSTVTCIPAAERAALIALYNSTNGDSWTNNSGWKTPPLYTDGFAMPGTEGTWFGITVNSSTQLVTAISLSSNNMMGSLPSALGLFTGLTTLSLGHNALTGPIPAEIGNLIALSEQLTLGNNQLTGEIPGELGNLINLTRLDLRSNQLSGQIPAGLGGMANLQILHLDSNQLNSTVPAELGGISSLTYLSLPSNQLIGPLPPQLGNLVNLVHLDLSNNPLGGSLPTWLGNLTNMAALYFRSTQISGPIPDELGNLIKLQVLYLDYNSLSGSIPSAFGNLVELAGLHLGNNELSGSLPAELGNLAQLRYLQLDHNQLSGPIPAELGSLNSLWWLFLDNNQLSGSIPVELGNLASLQVLRIGSNQLSGSIPAELGNLTSLDEIVLNSNQLSGQIPAELGNLVDLRWLCLSDNQLSGTIPAELGNLTSLGDLRLNDNQMTGQIPAWLGNLASLRILELNSNQFSGSIPVTFSGMDWLWGLGFGYNGLYAADPDLIAFLDAKAPDWAATQTIAPEDVSATPLGGTTALVSWTPILYQGDAGGYIVSVGTDAGGPYTLVGQTADKSVSSMTVSGLVPGTPHYFVVRTHTDAHANNQNAVESEDSTEAQATTLAQLLVTGTVLSGGSPLAGVVLAGMPGEPATNASGMYQGLVDPGWSGTVTPALAGYTFAPPSYTYAAISSDQWNQNHEGTLVPASITVTSPNGGEAWAAGSSQSVTWTATGLTGAVTVDLYKGAVYQKTLGTADAGDGSFIWAISAGEIPGTDYRVLVWQGSVSDESDGDFTILQAAATKRVDFNADGQEDILWRYQGTGAYQGLVLAWLMNQTTPLMPPPPAPNEPAAAEESLLTAPLSGTATLNPEVTETLRTLEAKSPSRTIMGGKAESIAEPRVSLRNALDIGRELSDREQSRYLRDVPNMTDAVDLSAVGSGTTRIDSLKLGSEVVIARVQDTGWEIAGTGDFNSDGKVDILWRYYGPGTYQGLNVIWHMNGTSRLNEVIFSRVTDTNWRIVGTGDFNSDGKVDILWRYHGTGTYQGLNLVWHMDGTTRLNEVIFSRVSDTNWRIAGTGDFNSDGMTDILWRYHGTGTYQGLNLVWHMDGTTRLNEVIFSRVTDTAWEIGGTGDFDSDGKVDILWRYYGPGTYQGLNVIWYMDGTTRLSEEIFSRVSDTNWRIANK